MPIDLTRASLDKASAQTTSTCVEDSKGLFIDITNNHDIVQTTMAQHFRKPMTTIPEGSTKRQDEGNTNCAGLFPNHTKGKWNKR